MFIYIVGYPTDNIVRLFTRTLLTSLLTTVNRCDFQLAATLIRLQPPPSPQVFPTSTLSLPIRPTRTRYQQLQEHTRTHCDTHTVTQTHDNITQPSLTSTTDLPTENDPLPHCFPNSMSLQ